MSFPESSSLPANNNVSNPILNQKEGLANVIPNEVLRMILANLDGTSFGFAGLVNSTWNLQFTDIANHIIAREREVLTTEMPKLFDFLMNNLKVEQFQDKKSYKKFIADLRQLQDTALLNPSDLDTMTKIRNKKDDLMRHLAQKLVKFVGKEKSKETLNALLAKGESPVYLSSLIKTSEELLEILSKLTQDNYYIKWQEVVEELISKDFIDRAFDNLCRHTCPAQIVDSLLTKQSISEVVSQLRSRYGNDGVKETIIELYRKQKNELAATFKNEYLDQVYPRTLLASFDNTSFQPASLNVAYNLYQDGQEEMAHKLVNTALEKAKMAQNKKALASLFRVYARSLFKLKLSTDEKWMLSCVWGLQQESNEGFFKLMEASMEMIQMISEDQDRDQALERNTNILIELIEKFNFKVIDREDSPDFVRLVEHAKSLASKITDPNLKATLTAAIHNADFRSKLHPRAGSVVVGDVQKDNKLMVNINPLVGLIKEYSSRTNATNEFPSTIISLIRLAKYLTAEITDPELKASINSIIDKADVHNLGQRNNNG